MLMTKNAELLNFYKTSMLVYKFFLRFLEVRGIMEGRIREKLSFLETLYYGNDTQMVRNWF